MDIHELVHSLHGGKGGVQANLRCGGLDELGQAGLMRQPNNSKPARKKISKRFARSVSGLQAKYVYRVSSSVNKWHFLWISRLTDEKSSAYALYKPWFAVVSPSWQIWTRFRAREKAAFLHKPYLWISRTLSTGGPLALSLRSGKLAF